MTVLFGNTPDAYTVNAAGAVQAEVMVTLYLDAARTTPATGLTDEDGSPSDSGLPAKTGRVPGSTVTSKTNGVLSFGAPDGTTRLYYDRGDGISSVLGPRADTAYTPKPTNAGTTGQAIVKQADGTLAFGTVSGGGSTVTVGAAADGTPQLVIS